MELPSVDLPHGDGGVALARLCNAEDWEDETWCALAERYFGGETAYAVFARSRWTWERVSFVHGLQTLLPPLTRPWVLVISESPEVLPLILAHQGYRVAYATRREVLAGEVDGAAWSEVLRLDGVTPGSDLSPLMSVPTAVRFDAVIAIGCGFLLRGKETVAAQFAALEGFAGIFAKDVALAQLGGTPACAVDARIPLDTAMRYALNDQSPQDIPGLSFGYDADTCVTVGLAFLHLAGAQSSMPIAPPADSTTSFATLVDQAAKARHRPSIFVGVQRDLLRHVVSARRTQQNGSCRIISGDGVVRFALPLGRLDPSILQLRVSFGPEDMAGANRLAYFYDTRVLGWTAPCGIEMCQTAVANRS